MVLILFIAPDNENLFGNVEFQKTRSTLGASDDKKKKKLYMFSKTSSEISCDNRARLDFNSFFTVHCGLSKYRSNFD